MTKEYSITFIGFIKNTPAGRAVVKRLREFLSITNFGLRLHGRNPNRKQFYSDEKRTPHKYYDRGMERIYTPKHPFCQDLPLKHAKTFAVYLRPHGDVSNFEDYVNDAPGDYRTKLTKDGKVAKKLVEMIRTEFLMAG